MGLPTACLVSRVRDLKTKELQDTHRSCGTTGMECVSETRDEQIDADRQTSSLSLSKTATESIRQLGSILEQTEALLKSTDPRSGFDLVATSVVDAELHR